MVSLAESNTKRFKRIQRGKFVLRAGFLDEQKRRDLHRVIPFDNAVESMHALEKQVQSGECTLAGVFEEGQEVGWTIFKVIEEDHGRELLSVASRGNSKSDLSNEIIPILEDIARQYGCRSIRLHTMRTGLVQKLIKLDWFVSEVVMRKEIQ
ncbi:hypothetical protein [Coraliomargarita parva]|uniref:hypothetical protein n=1 Tax=Coraliomargarita parva TaxID=3014050 RepID=UPI0022B4BF23|nr:hypothetical protein [Coraliomargarita parva]